jgi:hypothetical protein
MISIPIINSAIPKKTDTNTAPAKGDAITKKDIAMANAPAPILNPLAQPGLSLLPTPYTTWEKPRNSKPNPNINITNTAIDTGAATAIEPKIRASTPSPTVPHRDLFAAAGRCHLCGYLKVSPICVSTTINTRIIVRDIKGTKECDGVV